MSRPTEQIGTSGSSVVMCDPSAEAQERRVRRAITDGYGEGAVSPIPDEFADAWAAVFIDVYEKLKARGELPGDDPVPAEQGDELCPTT